MSRPERDGRITAFSERALDVATVGLLTKAGIGAVEGPVNGLRPCRASGSAAERTRSQAALRAIRRTFPSTG
ncbi:hypothetical protein ACWCXH_36450 [Kitasatospora sp. NPDC001660]